VALIDPGGTRAANDPRGTPTLPRTHPAFIASCGLGALGLVLIIAGLLLGGEVIFVVGAFAGFVSLIAALAWRADLVSTWRRDHPRR
jgi:hypothetical protein